MKGVFGEPVVTGPVISCLHCLLALAQLLEGFGHFRELGIDGATAEPQFVVDGGIAADHGTGRDVSWDAALSGGDGTIADLAVAGDADLSGENDFVADVGGAGEADLGAEESVFADGAGVADVDEIIELGAAGDGCVADVGAVDAGVGLDLDVVADDDVDVLVNL